MQENDIEDYLELWSQLTVEQIRENLISKDSWFDQSVLAQSIVAFPVEKKDGGYVIRIGMADYAEFVDGGRGKSDAGKLSPVEKIEDWITRHGIAIQIKTKSSRIRRNEAGEIIRPKQVNPMLIARRSMAFAIATKHKKEGFISKGKGFYSEIFEGAALTKLNEELVDKFGDKFIAELAE